jgi:hypothetical protein
MDRRELLKQIAILTGGVVIGGEVFLTGCKTGAKTEVGFTEANIAFLDEVGETILPTTKTPGAKAAKIGQFMKVIVNDCYEEKDQNIFHDGIGKLQDACKKETGKSFTECTPAERTTFLTKLDAEAKENQKKKSDWEKKKREAEQRENQQKQQTDKGEKDPIAKDEIATHYFTMMKQLTLWGYFTSKEGVMGSLRYVPVPGKYEGCVDYKKGDKIMIGLDG